MNAPLTLDKNDRFIAALHQMCSALHYERIDPAEVEISLPRDDWWALWCSIDRKLGGGFLLATHVPGEQFRYMGILFRPKSA